MYFKFNIKEENSIVNVDLIGYLDANNASGLLDAMKVLIGNKISKIIFNASQLEYIASAGLRVIVFTKQKIGYDADVVLLSPQESVVSVIKMSGLDNFITIE